MCSVIYVTALGNVLFIHKQFIIFMIQLFIVRDDGAPYQLLFVHFIGLILLIKKSQ